jgi:DNA-3-methyladenine glycosylase I
MQDLVRCWQTKDPLLIRYHDEEWGSPVHDDNTLYEFLVLGIFQAGLSFGLILKRRAILRQAFQNFDPLKVSLYGDSEVEQLLGNPKMIRNRAKIEAAITAAKRVVAIQGEFVSFDHYVWQFVNGRTIDNSIDSLSSMPSESKESVMMSEDMRRRGFKFVGPKIIYAFMQAVGMVNDHLAKCFRHQALQHTSTPKSLSNP